MSNKLLLLLSLLAMQTLSMGQDTSRADATLTSATVYFGYGAELTHRSMAKVTSATKQIIIQGVAHQPDINSLQISVPESISLLSQQFNLYTPPVKPIDNPLIRSWTDSIEMAQQEIKKNNNLTDIEQKVLEKTGSLIEMTLANNGNKSITSEEALKLVNAYTTRIEKAKTNIFQLQERKTILDKRIQELYNKINEARQRNTPTVKSIGQIILQVICRQGGEIPIEFSYFTNNAGFSPIYDVRVNSKTNEIKLTYKAAIAQSTGIDWKQTKLTLSTSNPGWNETTPTLIPWYLQLYAPVLYKNMQMDIKSNNAPLNRIPSVAAYEDMKESLVKDGDNYKMVESGKTITPSNLGNYTTLSENQLNTNFEIDLPYDIPCTGEMQMVTIKQEKLESVLKNYAVPKINREAFLLAELVNWQNLSLLPGTANIIMDDTYLGKSFIDPNITADTMSLSLGKDKRVAIKRSSIKEFSSTKKSNGTTKQTFTYEIVAKNNKTTEVELILKDQYPLSQVKEIETKLEEWDNAEINEESGILTWKLSLKPGESKKVRFTYYVKYPSDKKISNL
jgi:uncharacterized protein (TIGR02231 family)